MTADNEKNKTDTIEQRLEDLGRAIACDDSFVQNVMTRIGTSSPRQSNIRKFLMNRLTKFAAAAVIIILVLLSLTFLDKSAPAAYALEQTIQASHNIRYLHMRSFKAGENEPKEFWAELDQNGQVKNVRIHMPAWDSPSDGAKVVVWKEDKAQVWFRKKNSLLTIGDKKVAALMLKLAIANHPKLAVERMYQLEAQGKVEIDIEEPALKTEPIVVTATLLSEGAPAGWRTVLFVDQATRLVIAEERYELKKGEYICTARSEYDGYNEPIAAEMFSLVDEIPDDAMIIDQTIQDVGLVQGDLSNEEIAVEVVRQFWQALIDRNYAKAGTLVEGIPADKMQELFGKLNVVRIISIGPVVPHPIPATRGVIVPSTVEIQEDGKITEFELPRLGVRQVINHPARWTIFGGL